MPIIEEHRTSDGLLRFVVVLDEDGDITLGFEGFPQHTHGDILAELSGLPIEAAVREYINALLNGRSFIGIASVAGEIQAVWVTDDPRPDKYKPDDETIEFRVWNGQRIPSSRT